MFKLHVFLLHTSFFWLRVLVVDIFGSSVTYWWYKITDLNLNKSSNTCNFLFKRSWENFVGSPKHILQWRWKYSHMNLLIFNMKFISEQLRWASQKCSHLYWHKSSYGSRWGLMQTHMMDYSFFMHKIADTIRMSGSHIQLYAQVGYWDFMTWPILYQTS